MLWRCHDAPSEARAVADGILALHEEGTPLRHQAVLVRAAHHSDLIELELTARHVPFRKYGGLRFVEAAHVKDFVAAVRLLDNPADDVAWFRLLRLHDGVGPATARLLIETLRPEEGIRPAVGRRPSPPRRPGPGSPSPRPSAPSPPPVASSRCLSGSVPCSAPCAPWSEPATSTLPTAWRDLDALCGAAEVADDLGAWAAEVTLDPPVSSGGLAADAHLDEDYVVISTVHSAKGLEWPVVHLPHLVDGAFPSDMALHGADGLAEEQRLFYVALTRARDRLVLYAPLRMPHRRFAGDDRHSLAAPSRFLSEPVLATLELRDRVPSRPGVPTAAGPAKVRIDLEGLWR